MQNNRVFGDLSSTLEKLYVWEKKLYGEVVVNNYFYIYHIFTCLLLSDGLKTHS